MPQRRCMKGVREDLESVADPPRTARMSTAEAVFRAKLGHDLRAMYADVLHEPVPEDLLSRAARPDRPDRDRR